MGRTSALEGRLDLGVGANSRWRKSIANLLADMLAAGCWVGEAGYEKFEATVRIVGAAMEALGYSFITAYGHWEMAKKRLEKLCLLANALQH